LAFVDDMDLIVNDASNEVDKVSGKMQTSLSTWHGLLHATGGELVPDKCFWYLIDFKWNNNESQYKTVNEVPGQLRVKKYPNGHIMIPRLEPNKARWTLGVRIALDGNNRDEAYHLQEVATEWAGHIAWASLSRADAECSLHQVLLPKLTYALQAMMLSKVQCSAILKPALNKALPAMGINRHFP